MLTIFWLIGLLYCCIKSGSEGVAFYLLATFLFFLLLGRVNYSLHSGF